MEIIPGKIYTLKYKIVGNRGEVEMEDKVKIVEKGNETIKIQFLDFQNVHGKDVYKTIKLERIISAEPIMGGGRRRRSRKTRKSSRKGNRKSRRSNRK
jgi:hypothetical protein